MTTHRTNRRATAEGASRLRVAVASAKQPVRYLKAGDRSRAICRHCKAMRDIEYAYRAVLLEKTQVTVPNVLIGFCLTCDNTVSVLAQSMPRLKEARQRVMKEQNTRISLELEDRLNMMAFELDARPEPFKGALCRYALARVVRDKKFVRLVAKCAESNDASGTAGARLKFRAEAALPESALRVAAHVGVTDLSALLRGAILAVDVLLTAPAAREAMLHDLRLLALGSGA